MIFLKLLLLLFLPIVFNSCEIDGLNIFKSTQVKIVQRGSKIIVGSSKSGDLKVSLSDITRGVTELTIKGVKNQKLFFKDNLHTGDTGTFKYGDCDYTVKVDSFENHLFKDDFAFITVTYVTDEAK